MVRKINKSNIYVDSYGNKFITDMESAKEIASFIIRYLRQINHEIDVNFHSVTSSINLDEPEIIIEDVDTDTIIKIFGHYDINDTQYTYYCVSIMNFVSDYEQTLAIKIADYIDNFENWNLIIS